MFKRLFPICFAMVLLAAHFSRNGNTLLAFATILVPFLLFIKQRWVIYFLQTFAWLGSLSWAVGTYNLVTNRMAYGQPWTRMFIILSIVTLFTIWAAYWLNGAAVKEKYK
jgi:hypothetical protein